MQKEQYDKLMEAAAENAYMSIAINVDGTPVKSGFYLEDASLPDLKPLIDICNEGESLPGKCLGFCNCNVTDTSALSEVNFILSELLVWPVDGNTRERWKLQKTWYFQVLRRIS